MTQRLRYVAAPELDNYPSVKHLADTHIVANGLNVLFGPSGCYKTFYMLHQALTIAQQAPVVYIAAEGVSGLNIRIKAWCSYWRQPSAALHFILHEINLRETPEDFVKQTKAAAIAPALVVFDTYARCLVGGDENSAKDTGLAIQSCAQIQRGLGCAVTLVHHTNKSGQSERGSSAMRGASDAMIEMSDADGLVRVSCSKSKDGQPWPTELYRFLAVGESGVLLPAHAFEATDELTTLDLQVLDFLTLSVFENAGASARQMSEALNVPTRTLFRILSKLKTLCQVTQEIKGDPYKITDAGRAALRSATPTMAQHSNVISIKKIQ